jgi:serine/threonine-protein kinase HSL1 (negative regulator of Swe1 kinase)
MNSERNLRKGIYHLLVNYRRKYHDIRQQEEEEEHQAAERRKKKERRKSQALEASLPLRTSAPTPRRAKSRDHLPASSEGSLSHIHLRPELPMISFSAPSPEKTGPSDQAGGTTLPSLAAPELEDALRKVGSAAMNGTFKDLNTFLSKAKIIMKHIVMLQCNMPT